MCSSVVTLPYELTLVLYNRTTVVSSEYALWWTTQKASRQKAREETKNVKLPPTRVSSSESPHDRCAHDHLVATPPCMATVRVTHCKEYPVCTDIFEKVQKVGRCVLTKALLPFLHFLRLYSRSEVYANKREHTVEQREHSCFSF